MKRTDGLNCKKKVNINWCQENESEDAKSYFMKGVRHRGLE